jgi:hypothetical protein
MWRFDIFAEYHVFFLHILAAIYLQGGIIMILGGFIFFRLGLEIIKLGEEKIFLSFVLLFF